MDSINLFFISTTRSLNCNNSVPNNTYSITGCSRLANSGGEGNVGDPDFFLVELNSDPDFDPYFLVGIVQILLLLAV